MPAYRSEAEADIRNDVVKKIRKCWPNARIIHEINVGGQGTNRIDLIAVNTEDIAAFEIKSKKDKLDRLPKQMAAMRGLTSNSYAAVHEKFLVPTKTNQWQAEWTDEDGVHWFNKFPTLPGMEYFTNGWIWREDGGLDLKPWQNLKPPRQFWTLPNGALHILWADELRQMCAELRLGVKKRATMTECVQKLRWTCSGKEITRGICRQLRQRNSLEADEPIFDDKKVSEL